jgi:hypothetical protein
VVIDLLNKYELGNQAESTLYALAGVLTMEKGSPEEKMKGEESVKKSLSIIKQMKNSEDQPGRKAGVAKHLMSVDKKWAKQLLDEAIEYAGNRVPKDSPSEFRNYGKVMSYTTIAAVMKEFDRNRADSLMIEAESLFYDLLNTELIPQLCWGEWQKLCCSI